MKPKKYLNTSITSTLNSHTIADAKEVVTLAIGIYVLYCQVPNQMWSRYIEVECLGCCNMCQSSFRIPTYTWFYFKELFHIPVMHQAWVSIIHGLLCTNLSSKPCRYYRTIEVDWKMCTLVWLQIRPPIMKVLRSMHIEQDTASLRSVAWLQYAYFYIKFWEPGE